MKEITSELYTTSKGSVFQCNKKNRICVDFQGEITSFRIADFIDFTNRIKSIDLSRLLDVHAQDGNIAIISPYYTERCFVLTASEVFDLRELLLGAKFSIHLNSMINQCMLQMLDLD